VTRSAPTPDDMDKAKEQLSWVNKMYFSGDRVPPDVDACRKLLAHIAALEAKNKQMVEAIEMYLHNVDLMNKPGRPKAWNGDFVIQIMREAIAQTGDK